MITLIASLACVHNFGDCPSSREIWLQNLTEYTGYICLDCKATPQARVSAYICALGFCGDPVLEKQAMYAAANDGNPHRFTTGGPVQYPTQIIDFTTTQPQTNTRCVKFSSTFTFTLPFAATWEECRSWVITGLEELVKQHLSVSETFSIGQYIPSWLSHGLTSLNTNTCPNLGLNGGYKCSLPIERVGTACDELGGSKVTVSLLCGDSFANCSGRTGRCTIEFVNQLCEECKNDEEGFPAGLPPPHYWAALNETHDLDKNEWDQAVKDVHIAEELRSNGLKKAQAMFLWVLKRIKPRIVMLDGCTISINEEALYDCVAEKIVDHARRLAP